MTEKPSPEEASAAAFVAELETKRPEGGRVPMREIVALATRYVEMDPEEIEKLLDEPAHEARIGAVSVMGKQATRKRTTVARKRELYELYLRRTDRIDTWDLVDVSAHHVVGGYLADKDRDVLYRLARSDRWWERRIALFATLHFIRRGELDDTFALAEIVAEDEHPFVQTVTGGMLREAGKQDRARLLAFLDENAARMPRRALRDAVEKLDPHERAHYRTLQPDA
jgi:3-methyladenine DNA glycosylase AlkD